MRLSIGAKWTLRYSLAMLVTLSLFMLYAYDRVERRINKQAKLVLNQEVNAILAEEQSQHTPEALIAFIERRIANSDDELDLSVEWLEPDGTRRQAWGTLLERRVRPPDALLQGDDDWHYTEKELELEYPYFVMASAARDGFVQVAIDSRRFAESAGHIREVFGLAIPVLLLLTGVMGFLLARGSLRPVAQITDSARRIHGTNLGERLPTTGSGDELDRLAETLNEMIARIQQSMASLRGFTADAAHQLRTPLNAMRSQLEVTLEKPRSAEEYQKVLDGLESRFSHLVETVNAMLRLSESQGGLDDGRRVAIDVGSLLEELVEFFAPVAEEQGIALRVEREGESSITGDPTWLHQLFANLLHNALKYTPEDGRIDVRVLGEPDEVVVHVRDSGVGIPEAEQARVFERFHRVGGSQAEAGSGLGLTIAQSIAGAHGGRIDLSSTPGRGSLFAVHLPRG